MRKLLELMANSINILVSREMCRQINGINVCLIEGDRYSRHDTNAFNCVANQFSQVLIEMLWLWKDIIIHWRLSEMSCKKLTTTRLDLLQRTLAKMLIVLLMQIANICFAGEFSILQQSPLFSTNNLLQHFVLNLKF